MAPRSLPHGKHSACSPHTAQQSPLRQIDRDSEILSAPKILAGFDEDLAHETTRALNGIRSLLTQIHPGSSDLRG